MDKLESMVKETQAAMIRLTMDGHAYLMKHGLPDRRTYHCEQLNALNDQYKKLVGRYYISQNAEVIRLE